MKKTKKLVYKLKENWFHSIDNILSMASFIEEHDEFQDRLDVIYYFEKPYKYTSTIEEILNDFLTISPITLEVTLKEGNELYDINDFEHVIKLCEVKELEEEVKENE